MAKGNPPSIPPSIPPESRRRRPSSADAKAVPKRVNEQSQKPVRRDSASQYRSAQARRNSAASSVQNNRSSAASSAQNRRGDTVGQRPKQQPSPERRQPPPSYAPKNAPTFEPRNRNAVNAQSSNHAAERPAQTPNYHYSASPSGSNRPTQHPNRAGVPQSSPKPRRRRRRRPGRVILLLILIFIVAWPIGLMLWASSKIDHIDALSGAPNTPGTTFLVAGSDSRDGTEILDDTEGRRADTIMVLHKAPNGNAYLVSIPRDTWVEVPGYGEAKINASYAYGGEAGLVEAVEGTTGLTVDHFVEVGMSGVTDIVDSMGGIELCLDYDVDDYRSELVWESGCHLADGHTALAFARMRYSDPKGDIGRAERQRQVVGSVVKTAAKPSNLLNPVRQRSMSEAAAGSVVTDPDTSSFELAKMAWYFKKATSSGNSGAPPIATINLETYQGSAVLLDEQLAPKFFEDLATGDLKPEDFNVTTY